MFNKRIILFLFTFFSILKCDAQDCELAIVGNVFDEASQSPLSYVNVYIQELQQGTTTDDDGNFKLKNICPGHYHFIVSHIGCEDEKFHFDIDQDTILKIGLSHTPTSLGTVVISGAQDDFSNLANLSVKRKVIEDNSNLNLSALLENETGVHLIKNGNNVSKPIVHGLYGNRLIILNNGVQQSGQQWGNDHGPEIDPFSSDKITVLKGASAIEYGGGNLGSIILVQPNKIEREPHLHGQVNYTIESNGWGQTINTRLQKYTPSLSWRVNGTLKKYGDKKSSSYFLNNTGLEEANLSLQLEKNLKDNLFFEFFASTFNTQLGILRGSHIGNLTDLQQALIKDVPFFTEPEFSYDIDAPKQNVSHQLIKGKLKYFVSEEQHIELMLAAQLNNRKEFDIRRSGRTDIPALSLTQLTINSELKYTNNFGNNWKLKIGNQNIITDNNNNPETGILPLIPDYLTYKSGLFTTLSKKHKALSYNFGVRYDYEHQTSLTISQSIPREIIRFENNFHNVAGLLAIKTNLSSTQSIGWNIGYAMRNPAINELYSSGLHQGVSGIEEGDSNLEIEKAIKNTIEYKWVPSSNFALNVLPYYQHFNDYIYLNPQDAFRLTIRGAFPVFKYEQTNARIYGIDLSTQFTLGHSFLGLFKYSYLKGKDLKNDLPLIFMPPNSLFGSLAYRVPNSIKLSKTLRMEDSEFEVSNRYVFQQNNILATQDFALPPPAYQLVGLKFSTNLILPKYKLRWFLKADNLFNISYRDYLNRQRYFSDDLGISIVMGINIKF